MATGITFSGSDDSVNSGIREHGKLGVGDEIEALNSMLKLDNIPISERYEHRGFDRSQLFVRKSFPLKPSKVVKNLGRVLWIGNHSLVVLALIWDIAGLDGWWLVKCIVRGFKAI